VPLTDAQGQNVPYPTLSDKPNAQTAFQGIVDNLTPKTVMTYASATVRGATITVPKSGMLTWLQDVRRLEVYDGTGWSTVTAGSSAWTTVTLSQGYAHNGNNQGTFQYRRINLFGEVGLMFRGGLTVTYQNNDVKYTNEMNSVALPSNCRPTSLRSLVIPCSDVNSARITMKMDVTTVGTLNLWGVQAGSNPAWIGFNGVFCSL
jgi:hypothetical protein